MHVKLEQLPRLAKKGGGRREGTMRQKNHSRRHYTAGTTGKREYERTGKRGFGYDRGLCVHGHQKGSIWLGEGGNRFLFDNSLAKKEGGSSKEEYFSVVSLVRWRLCGHFSMGLEGRGSLQNIRMSRD